MLFMYAPHLLSPNSIDLYVSCVNISMFNIVIGCFDCYLTLTKTKMHVVYYVIWTNLDGFMIVLWVAVQVCTLSFMLLS